MSVDDRLREAFATSDTPDWDARREEALRAIVARRRREIGVRRGGVGLVLAGVAAGVAIAVGAGTGRPDPGPGPSISPNQPSSTRTSLDVLDGVWRTAQIRAGDVRAELETSGLAGSGDRLLSQVPPSFRLVWRIEGGFSTLWVMGRDERFVIDEEAIDVREDIVVLTPRYAAGRSLHRWVETGGRLRLDFVSTTEPRSEGAPGEAWQRVLYDAFEFTRDR